MWTRWTEHLPETEKEALRNQIRAAYPVLDRMKEMLRKKLTGLEAKELDPNTFGSPAWPYLQAATVGRKTEIREMIKLLTIEDE